LPPSSPVITGAGRHAVQQWAPRTSQGFPPLASLGHLSVPASSDSPEPAVSDDGSIGVPRDSGIALPPHPVISATAEARIRICLCILPRSLGRTADESHAAYSRAEFSPSRRGVAPCRKSQRASRVSTTQPSSNGEETKHTLLDVTAARARSSTPRRGAGGRGPRQCSSGNWQCREVVRSKAPAFENEDSHENHGP
jgi:hypothetical protein